MTEIYQIFKTIADTYGSSAALLLLIVGGVLYIGYLFTKNFSSIINKYLEKKLLEGDKKHQKGTNHRKSITPKVRELLSDLAIDTKANRALLFEYSNGTSNLVGLPFLYTSATCEIVTPGTTSVAQLYQKTNTSLIAEFLEKLDEAGYYLIDDLEEVKTTLPVVYNFMKPNNVKSALFYAIYGIPDTIGFLVITTTSDHRFCKKTAIARIAETAQKVGVMLNFNKIYDESSNR